MGRTTLGGTILTIAILAVGGGAGWFSVSALGWVGETLERGPRVFLPSREETTAEQLLRHKPLPRAGGDGVITGRVLNLDDAPVLGVSLELVALPPARGTLAIDRAGASPETIALREEIALWHFEREHLRFAASDAMGDFRFEGLAPDLFYAIRGAPNEAAIISAPDGREIYAAGDECVLRAHPIAWGTFTVLGRDGVPLSSAWLTIENSLLGERVLSYSMERSTLPVPAGDFRAFVTDRAGRRSAALDISVDEGVLIDIELSLASPQWIDLEWRGVEEPIDRQGLAVELIPAGAAGSERAAEPENPFSNSPTPSASPLLVLPDRLAVTPGTWKVLVSRGGETIASHEIEVFHQSISLVINVPPVDRRHSALVEATTSRGVPLDAIQLTALAIVEREGETDDRTIPFTAVSLGDGLHHVVVPPWEPSSASLRRTGTALLGADPELGRAQIDIELGTDRVQSLIFEPPAYAWIELIDYVGHPLQGRVYVSYGAGLEPRAWQTCFPDPLGRVRLGPKPPGPLTLSVSSRENPSHTMHTPLHLVSGENALAIALPQVFSLDLFCPDLPLGTDLSATLVGRTLGHSVRTGLDGVARFDSLRAGKYVFTPEGRTECMVLSVYGNSAATFTASKANALLVQYGSSGIGGRGEIEENDILVSVNGEEFPDLGQLERAFRRVLEQPPGTIEVERRGVIEQIVLEREATFTKYWILLPTLRSVSP